MERIRISCACLGRIEINGKFLLIQNKRSRNNGFIVYSPIGGALEYNKESYDYLISLDIEFEKGKDLRLNIPKENYSKFKEWFLSNKGRENSIFREMREEMVDEENFINNLALSDIIEDKINVIETSQDWNIEGVVKTSYYFFEIFDVKFSDSITKELLNNLENEETLKLFTIDEINTLGDDMIAGNVKYLFY